MEPITAIALAKSIISATGLGTWVRNKLGDTIGHNTANAIVDIATNAAVPTAGKKLTESELVNNIAHSTRLKTEVKLRIMEKEHALIFAELKDVKSARDMYSNKNEMADKIANRIISINQWLVLLLIAANCAVATFVKDSSLAMTLGSLISFSIGALWQERQQVIGFFFGSSLGSKLKSAMQFNPSSHSIDTQK